MSAKASFGQWLKRRRKTLDMTQQDLARRVDCAVVTIFKIEAGQRRPSKQIAELLAQHLAIPPTDHEAFVRFARSGSAAEASDTLWGTSIHPPNNLLMPPTPLIGRELDIAAVGKRLLRDDTQLLTLVGPPGIGKTRLSLAVAHEVVDEFPDGVFLILLAPISDPDLVPRAIVQTLGIPEAGPQSSLERLRNYLRDKQMLLVLDNFEQILPAAPQIAELLAACPFLKILITSRAPLRIRRERQFPVAALALPDLNRLPVIERLPDYAAVELFIERAQAVKPDFSLTPENGQHVVAICNRLDGLPLAIELISARVKLLPPAALLERLHGRLMLASDGLRDLESRHRTLNAAIGWSHELLDTPEKTLFRRLGVFVGGWTLEATEAVCQPEISTLDGMALLLDKSLLQQHLGFNDQPRFTMLETIREYALQRLEEGGEIEDIRYRHANFFFTWFNSSNNRLLDRFEEDYDNLRAALDWYFVHDLEKGSYLAVVAGGYWIQRGRMREGRFWLEKYVEACQQNEAVSPNSLRDLLNRAGTLAFFRDDLAALRQHTAELLKLGQEQRDKDSTAYGFFLLGQDALIQQDYERANIMFEESLTLSRQTGNQGHTASTLLMLGLVAAGQKDFERGLAYDTESLTMSRQLGNRWLESILMSNSAIIKEEQADYQEARVLCRQSMSICRELNDRRTLLQLVEQWAGLNDLEGDHASAARLMGAVEALHETIGAPIDPLNRSGHDRRMARLRANLDETAFATAWAEGRLMTLEQAIEDVLSE